MAGITKVEQAKRKRAKARAEKAERTRVIEIPYKPYAHQQIIHDLMDKKRFLVVVAARRSGKTVAAINHLIACALSAKDKRSRYAYIAPTYRQAKRIAWDYLKEFATCVPMITFNSTELSANFPNGARIQLYGIDNPDSLRGQYFDSVVLDEYGLFPAGAFDKVIRPALADREGSCLFTGTPNGRANDFYDKWQFAERSNDANWGRFHIGWQEAGVLKEYEVNAMRDSMTTEEFSQELEATFTSAVRGAYFADALNKAQDEGRITTVPYDPKLPVHTFWDLGVSDSTSIWFMQMAGNEIRMIEYMEDSGKGLDHYIRMLGQRDYIYGEHWGPFDLKVRELTTGMTRLELAAELGIHFNVVPRMPIQDGINAIRSIFTRLWFDRSGCDKGLNCLWNYRRDWDERGGIFKPKPVHDWASHGADSLRYLAMSIEHITNAAGIAGGRKQPRVFATLH